MSNQSKIIFKPGHVLNHKWVIIEFVGKGAMGEVYRAHQLNLKRDVAIKVISQEMLESFGEDTESFRFSITVPMSSPKTAKIFPSNISSWSMFRERTCGLACQKRDSPLNMI
jgi:serine/threonine protein kinase